MRRRRELELIAGRVNGDGSIAAGEGFVSRKLTTGQYRITFAPGFRVIVCLPVSSFRYDPGATFTYGDGFVDVAQSSTAGAGTLEDNPFGFIAAGVQT